MKFFQRIRTFLSSRFGRSSEREHGLSSSERESRLPSCIHHQDSSPLYNRPNEANISVRSYFQEKNRKSESSSKNSSISVSSRKDNSSVRPNLSQKRVGVGYHISPYVYVSETSVSSPFQPCYLPASAKHSFVEDVPSSNLTVKAGTPVQFNISVNDKFGRPVHKSVKYRLVVKQGKKAIFSGSTSKVTLKFVSVREISLLFYVNDELIPGSSRHLKVLPSKPHSLKDVTLKVESLPKDQSFTPQSNVLYHNQWTTFNAIVVDEFKNRLTTTCLVKVTSNSHIQFRKAKLESGCIQFSMKANDAGSDARIFITKKEYSSTDNFALATDIYVSYNPCSNILSEMTIRGINDQLNKFTFQVFINDVFGTPVPKNTEENCKLEAKVLEPDSEDDNYVIIEKSMCFEHDHLSYNLSVTGHRLWSKLAVFLNGEAITSANKFEVLDEDCNTLLELRTLAMLDDYRESIPSFLVYDNSRVFIPVSPNVDDGQLVPYNDNMCQIHVLPGGTFALVCKHTKKHLIMGPDFAHVNNIRRVLQIKDRLQVEENPCETKIIFDPDNVSYHQANTCKAAVLHLLRGSYYRTKASEAARARMDWKNKIDCLDEIFWPRHTSPTQKFCKYFKDFYGSLMNSYNRKACDELFSFFNFEREVSEVDLHGLLVADEEKLELLRLDMMSRNLSDEEIDKIIQSSVVKGNKGKLKSLKKDLKAGRLPAHEVEKFVEECESEGSVSKSQLDTLRQDLLRRCDRSKEVDSIIERLRSESDEAIRKLRRTLENFDLAEAIANNSPWIEIIVGAGHHSRMKEKQNIRPKVEKFLKERGNTFNPVNKGSLVVTFVQYSGPEPCFGEYYCEKCDRCWKSSKSYTGKYQKCSRCFLECWPVKQREKEKSENYRRHGRDEKTRSKPHQSKLCQRCKELGYPCNEENY